MSETLALTRFALQKHRLSLIFIIALVAIGVLSAHALAAMEGVGDQRFAMTALFFTMIPAAVWTFGLFAFSTDRDMLLCESGFIHWLLRLPIADWKLAMVPVALKTIWISLLWIVFALTLQSICEARPWLLGPAIGFSTVGIWLMVLVWRPFTNGWWRLGAFVLCGLVFYLLLVGVLVEIEQGGTSFSRWIKPLVTFGTYGMFLLGVGMSVRAVHLARTNSFGLIPEKGRTRTLAAETAGDWKVRHHRSPRVALIWHDLQKSREIFRWVAVLAVIPAMVLFTVFVPFSVGSYVGVMVVFCYFGFGASALVLDRTGNVNIVLPPYLAASPLGTATIAWTRMFTIAAIIMTIFSFGLVIFAGWTLFPENRETWNRWAGEMAATSGVPSAGLGIALATILGTLVVLIGRGVAHMWPSLCGRTWVHFTAIAIFFLGYMIPICVVIGWFLQQTSWEGTRESALYWLTYLPTIAVGALVIKVIGVAISIALLRSRRLASPKAIGWMIGGWLTVTGAIALALHLLIPYPQATLPWCLAAVAVCLPLARVLVLPVSLHFGRHL